jgi:hypothetical protein
VKETPMRLHDSCEDLMMLRNHPLLVIAILLAIFILMAAPWAN